MTSELTLKVYASDSSTLVGTIASGEWRSASFADVNSQTGKFTLVLPNLVPTSSTNPILITNPALTLVSTTGRFVRFLVDGTARFQGIIEDRNITVVAPNEQAGEVTVIEGRGTLALFDKVQVRPDAGTGVLPWHPSRWFNFAANALDRSTWAAAVGQLPNYDTDNYFGRPEGFTDTAGPAGTGPEWLWNADTRTLFAAIGVVYGSDTFTLASETDAIIEFAADDEGEFWIDDVPVIKTEGVYLGSCVKAGVRLSAGTHRYAWLGRNLNALRAGVVYAGWSVTNGMPDTLLFRSDDATCTVKAYPASPPGFTPTKAILQVISELQALAVPRLAGVSCSFTATADTDSAAVTETTDITCIAPGGSFLTLLMMLGETYLDLGMTATSLVLNGWIRGTRGSDVSATIAFAKGTCRRVAWDIGGAERATVALVSGNTFAPFTVAHADAATTSVYEEVALDFGDTSVTAATRFATDYLNLVSQARKGVIIELVPDVGPVPYVDFVIGDTISIPGTTGAAEDHRVIGIGCEVGPDSITRWTIELDQPRIELEERLGAIMRRQLPAAAGGRTVLPAVVLPQFLANTQGREMTHTWQFDGTAGNVVLKKNGTAITGASVTSPAAGATAKKTLTDAARKYVKGSDKLTIVVGSGDPSPEWIPPEGRWIQEMRATRDATAATTTVTVMVT